MDDNRPNSGIVVIVAIKEDCRVCKGVGRIIYETSDNETTRFGKTYRTKCPACGSTGKQLKQTEPISASEFIKSYLPQVLFSSTDQ